MKTRIEKLTPEQEAQIPIIRDEFLRLGLSTEPADFDAAEQAIKDAYSVAGLQTPKLFIRLASPREGAIGAAILKNTRLGENVRDQVRAQVRDQVWAQVGAQVGDQVWDQVWAQVGAQVWAQVGAQVWAQVGAQVGTAFYSQHEAAWLSWLTYFQRVCKLPGTEKIEPLARIAANCGWVWFFNGAAIITDRPRVLRRDDQNRLHCEDGPALEYRDGFAIHAWHGVRVPAEWIENRKTINPAEILRAENVEQRAAGCDIVGWARMLDALPHKIIDSHEDPQCGDLIEVTLPGLPEPELYLKFECPRNGQMMEAVNKRELQKFDLKHAHAWHANVPARLFSYPQQRS